MRLLFFLIFLICCIQLAYPQNQDSTNTKKQEASIFKEIQEVVITGQLSDRTTDKAVHKVRIIDLQKVNPGLFTNLGQLLEKEIGISISQDMFLGSSASIQGLSGQNVKILINSIPVIGRLNGNIDLSQISLNNIDRIEIIEGPLSTIFGTDAIAGTINIITKENKEDQQSINTYYESIGKYNLDILLSKSYDNEIISYQFERNYFNGWSENQDFKLIPSSELANENRFKEWKPKEQFLHKIQYNINNEKIKINNHLEHFSEKITNLGYPRGPYSENAFDEYYYTKRTNTGTNIRINQKKDKLKFILAYNHYTRIKETLYKDLTDLTSITVQEQSAQDTTIYNTFFANGTLSNEANNRTQYQFGINIQSESAQGGRIIGKLKEQSDYAFYGTVEYKLNTFMKLRPAARFIYNTEYKAPFIPSFNMLTELENHKIRFSLARGFRAPTLKELYLEFIDINHNIVGNNELLAEESLNIQFNITSIYKILDYKLKTDINLFNNKISNKINLNNSAIITDQYSYFNIEEYKTKGISSRIQLSKLNTALNIGLSYIGRYNKLSNSFNIPAFNFSTDYNISFTHKIGLRTSFNIFYKYIGQLPNFIETNNNISESYTDSYKLLDISINKELGKYFNVSIGGKNILNIKNINRTTDANTIHSANNNYLPVSYGRSLFVNLKLTL